MAYQKISAPVAVPKLAYTVLLTGFLAGIYRSKGETIYLAARGAEQFLRSFQVEPKTDAAVKAAADKQGADAAAKSAADEKAAAEAKAAADAKTAADAKAAADAQAAADAAKAKAASDAQATSSTSR
jgi:hypothetical protein